MLQATRLTRAIRLVAGLAALLALSCANALAETAPRLDGARIAPTSGDTGTLFTIIVNYFGPASPSLHVVYLDGVKHDMKYAGAAPQGATSYTYQTKLTAGTHKYRFEFKSGTQMLYKPGPTAAECATSLNVRQGANCSVSGRITANGGPLVRAQVKLTKSGAASVTVMTNSQGRFTATGLSVGAWAVTPVLPGYVFTPASRKVTVPPNTTTCDFTATRPKR